MTRGRVRLWLCAALSLVGVSCGAVDGHAGNRYLVSRVIDGDTFEVSGGQRVRVLGIDSCEVGTPGGQQAAAEARRLLTGARVTLRAEPGSPDRDQYGRLLRYVTLPDGRDFGREMVGHGHTGVFERGSASPSYLATLRHAGGRWCGGWSR